LGEQHNNFGEQHNNLGEQHNSLEEQHNNLGEQHNNLGEQHNNLGEQHNNLGEQHNNLGEQHNNGNIPNLKSLLIETDTSPVCRHQRLPSGARNYVLAIHKIQTANLPRISNYVYRVLCYILLR